ncbi:MAG: tetratricopeptide repeat protein [Brevundimonas sp.]|uniref:tetratricopeptide repeat protein n=1 Tax=Brevundimonas sp. TaxID=1871086 RepID=UPI004033DE1D
MALGAMGVAALAPLVEAVPALAQEAARSSEPLSVNIGANDGFTRIEFGGVVGARARVRREGQAVIVRIGTTAAPDVSRLKNDPPPGVDKVETRAVAGGTELVVTLKPDADARSGMADGAVWVNLYAPGKTPDAPARSAVPAGGVVPVTVAADADKAVLSFQWGAPVGAAVFRRGEAVWIIFDSAARLSLPKSRAALGPAGDARWAVGPDYTVVRVTARERLAVSAEGHGAEWTVTIGGQPVPSSTEVIVDRDDTAQASLVGQMAGATRAIWLTDPMAGDRFAAVTALAPGKGYGSERRTIDATLLPTAQGMAVETAADDLTIRTEGDRVIISRPRGLTLSAPSATLEAAQDDHSAPRKAAYPALILAQWADVGHDGFAARHRALQTAATEETITASDDPRTPIEARMAYARFLVASGLEFEAIGVLNAMVMKTPSLQGEPELRGLRGAARAAIGRNAEAEADFSAGALAGDPSMKIWQGYLASQRGDWETARKAFAAGAAAIDQFPQVWRARFGAAHALAAVEMGDLSAAEALLAYSFSQNAPAEDQLTARLVQAKLFELQGQSDRALAVYQAVARAPLDGIATPAKLGAVKLQLAKGQLKPDAAAAELEQLKWRWRGDATELAVIRTLGDLYLSQGRYREALEALRRAGKRMGNLPGAAEIQTDLSDAFRALFLQGAADGLQPVQALALFFDFREMTPVGADGDEMVRRLARRLIDVDLLDQAAELLKHQAESRLEGVAKAQVSTDLATVYLMDRQPEKALQALWSSRTTLLPTAMNSERRALEARALMELGRYDHALETLDKDVSPEAQDVRAEIFWKQQNWPAAARLYEQRMGERYKDTATPLSADEENRVIRAGVGYSLGQDAAALGRLSRNYRPFIDKARSAAAMRVALDTASGEGIGGQDLASLTARVDTFAGWVQTMKADFRKQTGAG